MKRNQSNAALFDWVNRAGAFLRANPIPEFIEDDEEEEE